MVAPAGNQAGDLRRAESADLDQIAAHHSFVLFRQLQVLLSAQDAFDQAINLLTAGAGEAEIAAGAEKLSHLGQGETFGMLPGDLHSPALCPDPTCSLLRSSCVGNTSLLQAHLALDNSCSFTGETRMVELAHRGRQNDQRYKITVKLGEKWDELGSMRPRTKSKIETSDDSGASRLVLIGECRGSHPRTDAWNVA